MTETRKETTVKFDNRVFSLSAVKTAAYKYLDSFVCEITMHGNEVKCVLGFTAAANDKAYVQLVDEFKIEVLDQDLREKLKAETEPIRNLILAHAFSRTGIPSDEQVSGNRVL